MKALVFERSLPRLAAARAAGALTPGLGSRFGALRLVDIEEPDAPGPGWERVRPLLSGICGSDLATVDGHASRWFEPIVSFPFVPGHEIVASADDGRRVVDRTGARLRGARRRPALRGRARAAMSGAASASPSVTSAPGLQTGYCDGHRRRVGRCPRRPRLTDSTRSPTP